MKEPIVQDREYRRPEIETFSTRDLTERIGPARAGSDPGPAPVPGLSAFPPAPKRTGRT